MDDRFFNGIIGCEAFVCGRKLRCLTPWHHVLLSAVGNPVIDPEADVSPHHILAFLCVTQCQWPDVPDLRPRLSDAYWLWRMRRDSVRAKNILVLREWMDVQLSAPKLWNDVSNTTGSMSSPSMFGLVVELVSKGNLPLERAWNMRISEARWYDVTLAELAGGNIRVAYENEVQPASQLEPKTEDEITAIARKELSRRDFERWLEARMKANRK